MSFYCFKALSADHMLNPAGVFCGNFRIYSEACEPGGQKGVAFIDTVGNLFSGFGKGAVRVIYPSGETTICPLSLNFFMATLTLDFLKFSSVATSTERTTGRRWLKTRIVSR